LPKIRLKSPMNTIVAILFYSWLKYHLCHHLV
jgi:hypothetical protein